MDESLSEEIARLHLEIRGLNGQLEGSAGAMAGLRERVAQPQQENADLKKAAKESVLR